MMPNFVTTLRPFEYVSSGEFRMPDGVHLWKLSTPDRQLYYGPDFFTQDAVWVRPIKVGTAHVIVSVHRDGLLKWFGRENVQSKKVLEAVDHILRPIRFSKAHARLLPTTTARRCQAHSPLFQISSASLDEALIKAVIRQVISAKQARKLIHKFIISFGASHSFNGHRVYFFPELDDLKDVSEKNLQALGFGFKSKTIIRVIRELRTHLASGTEWSASAQDLVRSLIAIRGIGSWTSRVAVADIKGDWSYYPFDDLAVRKWANRLIPGIVFPDSPPEFHTKWLSLYKSHAGVVAFYITTIGSMGLRRASIRGCHDFRAVP